MKVRNYLEEKEIWFVVYDNEKETIKVYGNEVEGSNYDKTFSSKSELEKWLKKNKFKKVGVDKTYA